MEKQKIPFRAHIIDEKSKREQSVQEHLHSVASIASHRAASLGLEATGRLLGLLHDMGKYTEEFDSYLENAVYHPEKVRRGEVNHSSAGARYLYELYGESPKQRERFTAQILAIVISSHHGLYDCINIDTGECLFPERRINPRGEIAGYHEARSNFFKDAADEQEIEELFRRAALEVAAFFKRFSPNNRVFQISLMTRLLLSLLIEGDWSDTGAFVEDVKYEPKDDTTDWNRIIDTYESKIREFSKEGLINELRSKISDDCKEAAKRPGGIYHLIVPTGGGKTLASLRFALHHLKEHKNIKRIFYIIPYLSILEQNAVVIRDFVGDSAEAEKSNSGIVFEYHSNVDYQPEQKGAANNDNDSNNGNRDNGEYNGNHQGDGNDHTQGEYKNETHKAVFQGWEDPIIITTLVQFLNALFSDNLQSIRRMHGLANSVIILDEVQSLPLKTLNIFNLAINFLANCCGATVVLCSATQPVLENKSIFKTKALNLDENPSLTQDVDASFKAFKRVDVVDMTAEKSFTTEGTANLCLDIVSDSDQEKLLVICNTKKQAAQIFMELKNREVPDICLYHLSTNMVPAHRIEILNTIKQKLNETGKMICVTTNLIEAGVDVDFYATVRVVAGLDNAIQAAGRCNRHGERKTGILYIIQLADNNLSRLPEVEAAQTTCLALLQNFKEDNASYNHDLFSTVAIKEYYKWYFSTFKSRNLFEYPLPKKPERTIFQLLSENPLAQEAFESRIGNNAGPSMFFQSFKMAARAFEVIPNDTVSIVVPFGEGQGLIAVLNSGVSIQEKKKLLKKAQRFSVNVYGHMLRQLHAEGAVYPICENTMIALHERFYNAETGLTTMSGNLSFLDC